ncbi:hypothetical protein AAG906_036416 [Vitis piasezkii]
MHWPSSQKVEEETRIKDRKVMTSLREDECLHVDEQEVEWIIDTATSYDTTPHLELFSDYKVGDFETVKMGNCSHFKIVRMSYENHFGKGKWKLIKGSLVVAKGKACCTLYKTQGKVSFSSRSKKKLEKLKLVYYDVCGPMDVKTLGGNKYEKTVLDTPQHNGMVQMMNRTIIERVRCMLKTAKLPKVFCGEASQTACYLINRFPSSSLTLRF